MDNLNVYQRIANVMKDVQYLTKDDRVEFKSTKYSAISEEKVTSTVRAALIEHGLIVYPIEQHRERVGTITSVDVKYRLQNINDPEDYIIVASSGDGADTQDKGAGKAMTYAFKYMFLRTFAIPTGEDPDKISSAQLDAEAEKQRLNRKLPTPERKLLANRITEVYGKENALAELKRLTGHESTEDCTYAEYEFALTLIDHELKKRAANEA